MATEVQNPTHAGILQRPLRGSRISTFYPVKSLPALSSLDSAFQLQEYISLLIRLDVHDVETITTLPSREKEVEKEAKAEEEGKEGTISEEKDVSVDEACWIYEQLRRLAQDLTHPLITTLQQECSRTTCPEMKAGEWLYLCVAHGTEGAMEQCCAIDYILHTLDSATALLNSPRAFPSRLQIPTSSHRHFPSLARRLGRIFAHAYFHHREAFEQAEAESSLYARFLALTSKFDLVPSEFLMIPPSAGVSHGSGDSDEEEGGDHPGSERSAGSGFGLREVKLGTSYDPRKSQSHADSASGSQHQLPTSYQEEFPDVPRTRRLPQQYASHQQYLPQQQSVTQETVGGAESPRKTGRNRTHTMVLSEAANVVDDLAKAAAAARAEEEREREEQEREARAREEAEKEEREKAEAEAQAKRDEEVEVEDTDPTEKDGHDSAPVPASEEKEDDGEEEKEEVKEEDEPVVETVLAEEPKAQEDDGTPAPEAATEEEPSTTTTTTQEVDIVEGATVDVATTESVTQAQSDEDTPESKDKDNQPPPDKVTTEDSNLPEGVAEADVATEPEKEAKTDEKAEAETETKKPESAGEAATEAAKET